ncbi:hypothetical protein [uncultured Nevskia sp.]|uniref:hypothetical protein n=1 Tax=uncultured Nevskia sp. TaxID=228950 RepID=UPI0025E6C93E|nr:hypothetical protein [uncultured Nevskia sp.]
MQSPDFAQFGATALEQKDLLFLFEHFPVPGTDAVEAARRVIEQPSTLESLLESRYVQDAMLDPASAWVDVSPKLYFNVMLRRALAGRRDSGERRTIHYLSNLLALFSSNERLHRVQAGETQDYDYLVDLMHEAQNAGHERRFLVLSQIGNYALFLAGWCAPWIEHRRRYFNRPLGLDYYCNMSRSHFASAAKHELADTFGLKPVFAQLAVRFDYYRGGIERMASTTLH